MEPSAGDAAFFYQQANSVWELSMSMSNGEAAIKDLPTTPTYQRLEKDVSAVKNDIAALTDQITDALNTFAGQASKQARRGYKQARDNVDSALDDASERGSAMLGAAQDAAVSTRGDAGGRHHPAAARDRRPCARPRLPDRRDVAPVNLAQMIGDRCHAGAIGHLMQRRAAMVSNSRRKPNFLNRWRRWWAAVAFVDALYRSRRPDVAAFHR